MMDKKEALRQYLRAARRERETPSGPHLSHEDLILFQEGRLAPADQEPARRHILTCDACRAAFKDVNDFFELLPMEERIDSPLETHRRLDALWPHVRAGAAAADRPGSDQLGPAEHARSPRRATLRFALAAMAAAVILWLGIYVLRLRSDIGARNEQLVKTEQQAMERIVALAEQNRQYQKELAELPGRSGRDALFAVSPSFDLVFAKIRQETDEPKIILPEHEPRLHLRIQMSEAQRHKAYALSIADAQGNDLATAFPVYKDQYGFFYLVVEKELLKPGAYFIKLYDNDAGKKMLLARYRFHVRAER